jgi:hypothetical protein
VAIGVDDAGTWNDAVKVSARIGPSALASVTVGGVEAKTPEFLAAAIVTRKGRNPRRCSRPQQAPGGARASGRLAAR